jgi:threonine/homoserine/homoserine lactone efflux protein
MSTWTLTLLSVAGIWGIAVITPGPNFFLVARTAMRHSRMVALCAVMGIALGTAIWGLAGFFGLALLFAAAPWAYLGMKVLGGAYLVFLGCRMIRASFGHTPGGSEPCVAHATRRAAVRLGLLTNLANPKTAAFVASLFASAMPWDVTLSLGLASVALMTTLSLCWYSLVAGLFSSSWLSGRFRAWRHWIDRLAGAVFVGFGVQLSVGR